MAGSNNDPAKLLLPYLQRADELQHHDPLVAYYCRMYAMERGLKIPKKERTIATTSLLVSLIKQLEKDRKSLKFSPDDHLHLEGFALNVFAKADKQYRTGRIDMNTAKTFYAASIFFEILNHSGEITPDLEQKQKYAAWKAVDIRKALKEGRRPVPNPPGGETDVSTPSSRTDVKTRHVESDTNPSQDPDPATPPKLRDVLKRQPSTKIQTTHTSDTTDSPNYPHPHDLLHHPHNLQNYTSSKIPTSASYPNFQSYPSFSESSLPSKSSCTQYNDNIPSRKNRISQMAQTIVKSYEYDSSYQPPPEKIAEAQKAARFAEGALASNELHVAVEHLRKALEFLTNPSSGQ